MPVPGQEKPELDYPLPDFFKDLPKVNPLKELEKEFERYEKELEKEKQPA